MYWYLLRSLPPVQRVRRETKSRPNRRLPGLTPVGEVPKTRV